jgi:hypothetical protein
MAVEIAFFNASGRLSPALEADVRAGISDAISALRGHVDLGHIGIAVHLSELVGRETGLGGYAYGADSCAIYVDHGSEVLCQNTRANAAAIAIHELHHVLRMRQRPWPRFAEMCAGEVLALEGLATHCEMFLGYPEPRNVCATSEMLTLECLATIAPVVGDPGANWGWIYGLNGFPERVYRAVYPMGHCVVGAYLARTARTPITALGVPWEDIWREASDLVEAGNALPQP